MVTGKRRGDTVIAHISCELDQHSAGEVRARLEALIQDERVKRLEIDLSGMTFMDSSGIGVLLGRYKTLQRRSGMLAVCNPSPHVDRILRLSGLYQIIERQNAPGEAGQ